DRRKAEGHRRRAKFRRTFPGGSRANVSRNECPRWRQRAVCSSLTKRTRPRHRTFCFSERAELAPPDATGNEARIVAHEGNRNAGSRVRGILPPRDQRAERRGRSI